MRDGDFELELRKVEEWLFAVLRFAVTREEADRDAILAVAANMDRLGAPAERSGFAFFVRTSNEICNLIVSGHDPEDKAALCHYLNKIGNDRLRRALEGALGFQRFAQGSERMRGQHGGDLWRGLPSRH
jgi:hypothetical protein